MSKFDFKRNVDSGKSLAFDNKKYKEARDNAGAVFFGRNSKPSEVEIIKVWLSADGWISSVEDFDDSAYIQISDMEEATLSISLEDARMLLVHLQALVEDAGQIREALTEVLPMKDSDEDD